MYLLIAYVCFKLSMYQLGGFTVFCLSERKLLKLNISSIQINNIYFLNIYTNNILLETYRSHSALSEFKGDTKSRQNK